MLAWLLTPIALAIPPDLDGDGYNANVDCNDLNAAINPGAAEIVGDNTDQDCDGHATCYRDDDNDGARTNTSIVSGDTDCSDANEGRSADDIDCDDSDATIHPGATEIIADNIDEDCDTDERCYRDNDNDGARTRATITSSDTDCNDANEGRPGDDIDCDDSSASVHPGAAETIADGIDQSCDGQETCKVDADNDNYRTTANVNSTDEDCSDAGEALLSAAVDCDDASAVIHPGATEIIGDHIDEDCDTDERCYRDNDNDGARTSATILSNDADCLDVGEGAATDVIDCNDANVAVYPGATELAGDNIDQDCNGTEVCYVDLDDDGARSPLLTATSNDADCADPFEALANDPTDCVDTDAAIFPGATELVADGIDQDCDGGELCYADADDDGARTDALSASSDADCFDAREGIALDPVDCNDADATALPGGSEITGNGVDNDCEGGELCWADADDDGARSDTLTTSSLDADCDDTLEGWTADPLDCDEVNAAIHPGATELTGDEVDQDCDGTEVCFADSDADGARNVSTIASTDLDCADPGEINASALLDCDDSNAAVSPTAAELCDEIDNDCDGQVDFDDCNQDDIDNDGLRDVDEEDLCASVGLPEAKCPANPDVDSDGVIDGMEVGSDVSAPMDSDGDGDPDFVDTDDDGDSVLTRQENGIVCSSELLSTYDAANGYWLFECDGVVYDFGGNAASDYVDTDGDAVPNYLDSDDDNDGVDTLTEWTGDIDCDDIENYVDADDADGPCIGSTTDTGEPTDTGDIGGDDDDDNGDDDDDDNGGDDDDDDDDDDNNGDGSVKEDPSGCGCADAPGTRAWSLALLILPLLRRRYS